MSNSTDPTIHQQAERDFVAHVEKLLNTDSFKLDTSRGLKSVTMFTRDVKKDDAGVDLKRVMAELGKTDRELQGRMPAGLTLSATLFATKWWLFKSAVGRLQVVCLSPTRPLLTGGKIEPVGADQIRAELGKIPPALGNVPTTIIFVSTSGFTAGAREKIDRQSDRVVLLAQPNDAGGWSAFGPPTLKASVDMLDPEAEELKKTRLAEQIKASHLELMGGGITAEKIASRTQLPLQWVEAELKNYARANPGLNAKRLDGHVVLFREGSAQVQSTKNLGKASGGLEMPFIDSLKSLFSRKGETEKKIALLSEHRASLSQKRDSAYDDLGALEANETALKDQFKAATSESTKRRLTSQLLQAKKDLARRQQLMSVLNQQIDVVSTHLHTLELVHQGKSTKLPDGDDLTKDAEAAEEVLAQLQADTELAGSLQPSGSTSLSEEEQALYDELQAENAAPQDDSVKSQATGEPSAPAKSPDQPPRERQREAT